MSYFSHDYARFSHGPSPRSPTSKRFLAAAPARSTAARVRACASRGPVAAATPSVARLCSPAGALASLSCFVMRCICLISGDVTLVNIYILGHYYRWVRRRSCSNCTGYRITSGYEHLTKFVRHIHEERNAFRALWATLPISSFYFYFYQYLLFPSPRLKWRGKGRRPRA